MSYGETAAGMEARKGEDLQGAIDRLSATISHIEKTPCALQDKAKRICSPMGANKVEGARNEIDYSNAAIIFILDDMTQRIESVEKAIAIFIDRIQL